MAQNWNQYVNTQFYGQDGGYKDNTENVEFKSGRVIKYLKNSSPKKKHALNFVCKDKGTQKIGGRTEFEWFLYWYENTIKSGTEPFYLTDIITGRGTKEYMMTETPSWSGQQFKTVNITLEEV